MNRKFLLGFAAFLIVAVGALVFISMTQPGPGRATDKTSYGDFLPDELVALPEDFYPNGLTRDDLQGMILQATRKTGMLENETWSGVILVTGDTEVDYLVIEPGTVVFIEENSDDQGEGGEQEVDPVNPHEFLGADYGRTHTAINVRERLVARGTPDAPIIFTSTAEEPWLADWDHLIFRSGVLEYAVVEHCWGIAVDSSDVSVSHCVIRNVLQQGLMFGYWPEAGIHGEGSLSPNVTYNFVYNVGHMAVQSFFSDPYIAHNVFIQKHTGDPELYAYLSQGENGALDIHGGNGTILHNFLSSGYDPVMEEGRPKGGSPGIVITEATAPELRHNIITGNLVGIEVQGGIPVINENNIHGNVERNLVIRPVYAEPGRKDKAVVYESPLDCLGNWWGTANRREIMNGIGIGGGIEIEVDPFSESGNPDNGPDWREFEWLYPP